MGALVLATVAIAVGANSCSDSGDGPDTPAEVLERGGSIARVTIGSQSFDFEVTCYDAGAGSVIAVGTGRQVDASAGGERPTRILVQAFLGDPYIGVTVGPVQSGRKDPEDEPPPTEVYEASLEDSFDLVLEDDVIAADSLDFVRNIDLAQGDGEPMGEGSLHVTCSAYEQGVPPTVER